MNPFGSAFMAAGFQWTAELCAADSDGDGRTNGEELGDPCCMWKAGDEPSLYMAAFQPSHPGFGSHTQPQDYAAPACDSAEVAPSARAPQMSSFNEGEVQHVIEWRIKNYELPKIRTTYVNIPVRRPPATDRPNAPVCVYHCAVCSLLRSVHRFLPLRISACDGHSLPTPLPEQPATDQPPGPLASTRTCTRARARCHARCSHNWVHSVQLPGHLRRGVSHCVG